MDDVQFKKFKTGDITRYETIVEPKRVLTSQSLDSVQFISESWGPLIGKGPTFNNSHYWRSLRYNFYNNSSSYPYRSMDREEQYFKGYGPQNRGTYYTKFNISGSIISISQKDIGDNIVPGTFILRDNYYSSSIKTNIKPILKDDGRGNIYATNAYVSQSNGHLSSSDNHVGNIFYDFGMVVLKETGSWSGSVSYMDIGRNNYEVEFKASHILYSTEYNCVIEPNEFLQTSNITARGFISTSAARRRGKKGIAQSPYLSPNLLKSKADGFTYITHIGLYGDDIYTGPLIMAALSKPLRMTSKVPITIRLKFDMII
jgi:hypothetical protein